MNTHTGTRKSKSLIYTSLLQIWLVSLGCLNICRIEPIDELIHFAQKEKLWITPNPTPGTDAFCWVSKTKKESTSLDLNPGMIAITFPYKIFRIQVRSKQYPYSICIWKQLVGPSEDMKPLELQLQHWKTQLQKKPFSFDPTLVLESSVRENHGLFSRMAQLQNNAYFMQFYNDYVFDVENNPTITPSVLQTMNTYPLTVEERQLRKEIWLKTYYYYYYYYNK